MVQVSYYDRIELYLGFTKGWIERKAEKGEKGNNSKEGCEYEEGKYGYWESVLTHREIHCCQA